MWNPVWRTCKLNTVIPSSSFISHSPIIQASYLQPIQVPLKSYQVSWHCAASHHWVGKATNKVQPFHLCQRDQTLGSSDAVKLVSPHGLRSARRPAALSNTEGCLGCLAAYIYIYTVSFQRCICPTLQQDATNSWSFFWGSKEIYGDLWQSGGPCWYPSQRRPWPRQHGSDLQPKLNGPDTGTVETLHVECWKSLIKPSRIHGGGHTHIYIYICIDVYIYIHMYWCIYNICLYNMYRWCIIKYTY